jgi:multidrug efflux pump subunit AcrB
VSLAQPEVTDVQAYSGTASPFNFNGLVRHYYLRAGANVADIQVNLLGKEHRHRQSHEIAKSLRVALQPAAKELGANIKVAEVPPGPPVLQTLVAEVYGPTAEGRMDEARKIRAAMESIDGIVDIDWYVEDDQPKQRIVVDRERAAAHGVTEAEIASTLRIASAGESAGLLHDSSSMEDVPLRVRLHRAARSELDRMLELKVRGISLRELARVETGIEDKSIYHKNLMPVT